jgi:hypothetical protein
MPLPVPPPLRKPGFKRLKVAEFRAIPREERPLTFPDFEAALYDKDITRKTGIRCRTCLKFRRCTLGPQQMLACFAYFLWHPHISTNPNLTADSHFLETCPLREDILKTLTPQQMLGVFFLRGFSPWTLVDFSPRGLRARLRLIQEESEKNSPYLLTTE